MKFSIAVTLFTLASSAWAANGAVSTVDSVAATIQKSLTAYQAAIGMFSTLQPHCMNSLRLAERILFLLIMNGE